MRLIETITIYLAAGAPFSVSYLLHAPVTEPRGINSVKALAAGLLWPVTVIKFLVSRVEKKDSDELAINELIALDEKVDDAKRGVVAAIHKLSELAANVHSPAKIELARAVCILRENVETYVGLSPGLCLTSDVDSTGQANELFQVSGHKGDDLLLATRCANRRNVARITAHYTRARFVLIHAIADVRDALDHMCADKTANDVSEQQLRITAGELYRSAFDLFSLMADDEAAMRVAELLNRELSRLRRMEMMNSRNVSIKDTGEEQCEAHLSRRHYVQMSDQSTLTRG